MGDGLNQSPIQRPRYYKGQENETRTIGEYVDELTAYYMAIGMPRDEFFLNPDRTAVDDYEKAWECKQINENRMLHLQGLYNYQAFGSVLSSAFAAKGKKGEPYLEYPIPITETERKAEKQRKIQHTLDVVRGRKKNAGRSD